MGLYNRQALSHILCCNYPGALICPLLSLLDGGGIIGACSTHSYWIVLINTSISSIVVLPISMHGTARPSLSLFSMDALEPACFPFGWCARAVAMLLSPIWAHGVCGERERVGVIRSWIICPGRLNVCDVVSHSPYPISTQCDIFNMLVCLFIVSALSIPPHPLICHMHHSSVWTVHIHHHTCTILIDIDWHTKCIVCIDYCCCRQWTRRHRAVPIERQTKRERERVGDMPIFGLRLVQHGKRNGK